MWFYDDHDIIIVKNINICLFVVENRAYAGRVHIITTDSNANNVV